MVLCADSGWESLVISDRVLVTGSSSRYRRHYGSVVTGECGSGFSPSRISKYVQFEIDGVLFQKSTRPAA